MSWNSRILCVRAKIYFFKLRKLVIYVLGKRLIRFTVYILYIYI